MQTLNMISESDLKIPEYYVFKSEYNTTQRSAIRMINESINMTREINVDNYRLYSESIIGDIVDFARKIIDKITTFIKKMFQSIVGFIAKPFGVKFSWMVEKEDNKKNPTAKKESSLSKINNKDKFKLNPHYFNYDFDLTNPIPIIQKWHNEIKDEYLRLKRSKGDIDESEKYNIPESKLREFNKEAQLFEKNDVYNLTGIGIEYLNNMMMVELDSSYVNKLKGVVEATYESYKDILEGGHDSTLRKNSNVKFTSIKKMLPNETLDILLINNIDRGLTDKERSFTNIPISLIQSLVFYLDYFKDLKDEVDPDKIVEYSKVVKTNIDSIRTEEGSMLSEKELEDKETISELFDLDNLPKTYSIYDVINDKEIKIKSTSSELFNQLLRVVHGKDIEPIKDKGEIFGIKYDNIENNLSNTSFYKELIDTVYSNGVLSSNQYAADLNTILTDNLNVAIEELDKLEKENERKDSYYNRLKRDLDKENEDAEDVIRESRNNIEKDLRFFKDVFDGEVKLLEDMIEFVTASEFSIKAALAITVLGTLKPVLENELTIYTDLIHSKNKIENKDRIIANIEGDLDLL